MPSPKPKRYAENTYARNRHNKRKHGATDILRRYEALAGAQCLSFPRYLRIIFDRSNRVFVTAVLKRRSNNQTNCPCFKMSTRDCPIGDLEWNSNIGLHMCVGVCVTSKDAVAVTRTTVYGTKKNNEVEEETLPWQERKGAAESVLCAMGSPDIPPNLTESVGSYQTSRIRILSMGAMGSREILTYRPALATPLTTLSTNFSGFRLSRHKI